MALCSTAQGVLLRIFVLLDKTSNLDRKKLPERTVKDAKQLPESWEMLKQEPMQSKNGQPWAKQEASSEREKKGLIGKNFDTALMVIRLSSSIWTVLHLLCKISFLSSFCTKIDLLCQIWLWSFELCLWAHPDDGFMLFPSTMGTVSHSHSANTAISCSQHGSIHKHKTLLYFLHPATAIAQCNDQQSV